MKLLLATDGGPCSEAAAREIGSLEWPPDTLVKVLTVAHTRIPFFPDPFFLLYASHLDALEEAKQEAPKIAAKVTTEIQERWPLLHVTTQVREGEPKEVIVEEAAEWEADLILMGSHGYGPMKRFVLGSVALGVVLHAPCSVWVVRPKSLLVRKQADPDLTAR